MTHGLQSDCAYNWMHTEVLLGCSAFYSLDLDLILVYVWSVHQNFLHTSYPSLCSNLSAHHGGVHPGHQPYLVKEGGLYLSECSVSFHFFPG